MWCSAGPCAVVCAALCAAIRAGRLCKPVAETGELLERSDASSQATKPPLMPVVRAARLNL